ncbi:thioredoxin-like protein [Lactarius psammicola]|nr:thioredoxin-like protein [Lactarius psammicola]
MTEKVKEIGSLDEFNRIVRSATLERLMVLITVTAQINSGKAVAIDFWATWCGPCRVISPIFEKLAGEITGVEFYKVDVDQQSDISQEVGVRAVRLPFPPTCCQ